MEKELTGYEFTALHNNEIFINKYGVDLMYNYELIKIWKAFWFDLLCGLGDDIENYPELSDYVSFNE